MVIVLFGVSGAGKTTIGKLLAEELGWTFIDADDFHPPANIAKMRRGLPLGDHDREEWLNSLSRVIRESIAGSKNVILACSALKSSYRSILAINSDVVFVYLKADPAITAKRLAERAGHFLDPALLDSQFETLEEPEAGAFTVDTRIEPDEIVREIKLMIFS